MDLRDKRMDYTKFSLTEEDAGSDPYALFTHWYDAASQTEEEANVMILGTSTNNKPQNRVVLLKEVKGGNFVFYTNYHSQKGQAIDQNPYVSLLFFWQKLQKQVRIEGYATKVPESESDEYFYSRPIESQIGAIASLQSEVLDSRVTLEQKVEELNTYYQSNPIVRPKNWGGFAVNPSKFEFWQGRSSRLHDRICFEQNGEVWERTRLYP